MARPTWTTDDQSAWLVSRKKGFTDAQATHTTRPWLNATTEAFLAKWPILPPTEQELANDFGNDADAYYQNKSKKVRRQVEWWFRNRARANATGRTNATTAVLDLTRRRAQPLASYQAYMHVYSDRVMPLIKDNYRQYKADLPVDEQPREWWGWATAEAKRLLETEPEDVKAAVEAYRVLHAQTSTPAAFDLKYLTNEGLEVAQERVRSLQSNIARLARTAYEACKAIEQQTGWKATMLLGGPNPETGRMVSLTVHNGRTTDLQNIFSEATEKWPVVQNEWDTFITRCYRSDLCKRLEQLYRGDMSAKEFADLQFELQTEAVMSDVTGVVDTGAEEAVSTTATSDASSTPPPSSPQDAVDTPASTQPPAARQLSYDEERRLTVTRNKIVLQRILDGEKYEDIMATLDLGQDSAQDDDSEELVTPAWVVSAKEYLIGVSDEGWWVELVSAWDQFERALEYPDGYAQSNWLSPKARPEEVKYWIVRGRKYEKPPKIKSIATFINQFHKWWARLQPSERRDPDEPWPLLKIVPDDDDNWSDIRKGSCNGLFMVVMCLSWWIKAVAEEAEPDYAEVREAVDDVKWAIIKMVPLDTMEASESNTTGDVSVVTQIPTLVSPPPADPSVADSPAPNGPSTSSASASPAPASTVLPPASTESPAPATTAAPASTVSPAPASTASPAPASTASPTPASTASPTPASIASPAPATTTAPAPASTVSTESPAPTLTASPATATTASPAPATTASLAPATTASPTPSPNAGSKRPSPESEHADGPVAKKAHVDAATGQKRASPDPEHVDAPLAKKQAVESGTVAAL